jgi:hypothetical protein
MTTKIVKSRDSAATLLRKIGVAPTDDTLYIEKHASGFEVFVNEATASVGGGEVVEPAVKLAAYKEIIMDQTTKRNAAIELLTAAYDSWLAGEDNIFEEELDDQEEEQALEGVRQQFEEDCQKVFEL